MTKVRSRQIKQPRAQRTRSEILKAAIELFARRGILATTMSELAKAIGMTPGALYWHFPTKEDLLLAAVAELHAHYVSEFGPELAVNRKGMNATEQLTAFLRRIQRFLGSRPEHGIFFGQLGSEAAEGNERVAQALREALDTYIEALAGVIRYGQRKTKEFRDDVDPKTLACSILFSNVGIAVHQNLFRLTLSYDPLVTTLHQVVAEGVRRK
ncbi:MAG: helix-turn-helix domain-containing protein [Myxococcaceae bacterium]